MICYVVNGMLIVEDGTEEWTVNGVLVSEQQAPPAGFAGQSYIIGGGMVA